MELVQELVLVQHWWCLELEELVPVHRASSRQLSRIFLPEFRGIPVFLSFFTAKDSVFLEKKDSVSGLCSGKEFLVVGIS